MMIYDLPFNKKRLKGTLGALKFNFQLTMIDLSKREYTSVRWLFEGVKQNSTCWSAMFFSNEFRQLIYRKHQILYSDVYLTKFIDSALPYYIIINIAFKEKV